MEAVILAIDAERERISLGVKQLSQDTFSAFASAHGRGSVVKGNVVEVDERQAVIKLSDDINGILKASEAAIERVEDLTKLLSVGDEVEAKVINVDRKHKTFNLSVRAKDVADEKAVIQDYTRKEATAAPRWATSSKNWATPTTKNRAAVASQDAAATSTAKDLT